MDGTPRKPGEEDHTCSGHLVSKKKSDLLRMYNLCVLYNNSKEVEFHC